MMWEGGDGVGAGLLAKVSLRFTMQTTSSASQASQLPQVQWCPQGMMLT